MFKRYYCDESKVLMKNVLILITLSFPYYKYGENSFLNEEIKELEKKFDSFIILPLANKGAKQLISSKIVLDEYLASKIIQKKSYFRNIFTLSFFLSLSKELLYNKNKLVNVSNFKRAASYIAKSLQISKIMKNYFKQSDFENCNILIYTYWFTHVTTGVSLLKKNYSNLKILTRAHGKDLYEERNNNYLPYRFQTVNLVDRICFISQNGKEYFNKKYLGFSDKSSCYHLGVRMPDFVTKKSNDGVFRIVSCSNFIPIKRIPLMLLGIVEYASSARNKSIIWTHIGNSNNVNELLNLKEGRDIPPNLTLKFVGTLSSEKVYEFYKNEMTDVFVNISSTEGLPMTLMEAQSCGVPVIGTDVGGVSEIINDRVGKLISANPTTKEIAEALRFFASDAPLLDDMKKESRKNCEINFNAKKNYKFFAEELFSLCKTD